MRVKEESVKDKVRKILAAEGVWYCMPTTGGYGRSGVFDFIACVEGAFLGIETKRDDKEMPTQLQTDNAMSAYYRDAVVLLLHKDNIHLLPKAIRALREHMQCNPILVSALSYWPTTKPPEDDRNVKLIKKAKK